ncbi:MAG: hypothetical protein K6C94_00795 [Candidatus Gastranaerophilales bacterium]|nr:hypothetical protein [Candidatus Gastranaerophilales bacterium]
MKKILSFLCILVSVFFFTSEKINAETNRLEKVIYSEDSEVQESVDEELFEEEKEYEEYDVYTEEDEQPEDTTEMIILAPQNNFNGKTVLRATIEKVYSFRSVEAFNTIWDNSANYRTLYRTVPSMLQTAPSIIHAAHYRFSPDENTSVYWGHAALSSFNGMSVGFVGKLESDYDSGIKVTTRMGKLNVAAAIYDSLETNNAAGGILISSDEIKFKKIKGSFKFGGGFYTNEYGDADAAKNSAGLFATYTRGRFSLGTQIGKTQYGGSGGRYGTSFYLYPSFRLTDSLYFKSKIASHIDQNYNQEEIGLTYKPARNNPNEFSISLNASLYNGEGTRSKQRLKLSTEFKL